LAKLWSEYPYELVIYESVDFAKTTIAAHIWGGLHAVLITFCHKRSIDYEGVSVATLKKFATGKGNAKKEDMIAAARLWDWRPTDDNSADACCLMQYAIDKYGMPNKEILAMAKKGKGPKGGKTPKGGKMGGKNC
jgi:Holliday junction resolvasome RuvABC endonuclease subunit